MVETYVSTAPQRVKRPFEVEELIRTLNPDVPYKEFERARDVHALQEIVRYIHQLELMQK